ncbi:MAG: AAA family ATPase [Lachnospiraceae bacterium]|nr:AAA family ATPase [Lachnospiraceae bacterium]
MVRVINTNRNNIRINTFVNGIKVNASYNNIRKKWGLMKNKSLGHSMIDGEPIDEYDSFEELCEFLGIEPSLSLWTCEHGDITNYFKEEQEKTGIIEESRELTNESNLDTLEEDKVIKVTLSSKDIGSGVREAEIDIPVTEFARELAKEYVKHTIKSQIKVLERDKEETVENIETDSITYTPYTKEDFENNVHGNNSAELLYRLLKIKGALLFESEPGSGKTTTAKHLAYYTTKEWDSPRVRMVCFSATTSYSDVIGGIKVQNDGTWKYTVGSLTEFAELADKNNKQEYVYIIDEINRGNTESIIGELMTAMEKRGEEVVTNSGRKLKIPKNLSIIATMNTYDSSTKKLDAATLSRFSRYAMDSSYIPTAKELGKTHLPEEVQDKIPVVIDAIHKINEILVRDTFKGNSNKIGFRPMYTDWNTLDDLWMVVKYDILPNVIDRASALTPNDINNIKVIFNNLGKEINGKEIRY